jgi:hypothetical protein
MGVKYSAEWWQRVSLTREEGSPQLPVDPVKETPWKDGFPPVPDMAPISTARATTRIESRGK